MKLGDALRNVASDPALLEVGRAAIERLLVELRDGRISMVGRGNGLVIREKTGKESHAIRLGPEDGLRIGLEAIADHIEKSEEAPT